MKKSFMEKDMELYCQRKFQIQVIEGKNTFCIAIDKKERLGLLSGSFQKNPEKCTLEGQRPRLKCATLGRLAGISLSGLISRIAIKGCRI